MDTNKILGDLKVELFDAPQDIKSSYNKLVRYFARPTSLATVSIVPFNDLFRNTRSVAEIRLINDIVRGNSKLYLFKAWYDSVTQGMNNRYEGLYLANYSFKGINNLATINASNLNLPGKINNKLLKSQGVLIKVSDVATNVLLNNFLQYDSSATWIYMDFNYISVSGPTLPPPTGSSINIRFSIHTDNYDSGIKLRTLR